MIVIHNPTDAPIKDYPIQDSDSKEVLLWSILPGETLEFPDHVGKYLLEVYGFLQKVMTQDQYKEGKEEEKKVQEGKVFSQVKIVEAKGEVVLPTNPQPGFTNANMQPKGEEAAVPPVAPPVGAVSTFVCPNETCRQEFKQERHLKVHYALKHFEMPK